MNLPNKLTILRLVLVIVFIVVMMASSAVWASILGVLIFIAAAVTDMLDGKIARKYHLITNFGKLLDPLADKFMVIGAMLIILYRSVTAENPNAVFNIVFFWGLLIVIFRELAITSIRLIVAESMSKQQDGKKKDLAANMLGKIKTCTQIACVITCIVEPLLYRYIPFLEFLGDYIPLSFISIGLMTLFTLWSGINYAISYWKFLDHET